MYVDRWNDIMYTAHIYIYIFCSVVPFLQLFDFIYTFKMKSVLLKVTGSVALHRWLCVRRDESQYQWVATHSRICPPPSPPKKNKPRSNDLTCAWTKKDSPSCNKLTAWNPPQARPARDNPNWHVAVVSATTRRAAFEGPGASNSADTNLFNRCWVHGRCIF